MKYYFCSYLVIKNNSVFAYGDMSFELKVDNVENLCKHVKDSIIESHYSGVDVEIILTALNEI